ncbi:MAG: 23S rRNA (guanosine(2251)-2'-O)-methyltransferase RlmB [Candidatus Omnitrophica bacterium]|nr:23S rRNA (guanosine(2251)-2'-O)-methyltransferase RlmB [Candidatus Omnitrophota bacterium]
MRLYGKNPVFERLKSNPRGIKKIYIQQGHEDAGYVYKKAKKWGIPVYSVPKTKIQKIARNVNTQGIVLDVDSFEYLPYGELLEIAQNKKMSLLFLDGLNDPQNLGGIIRSVACLGHFVIILPTHKSVAVTETVLRVACGGDNYVKVAQVTNLSQAIKKAKEEGFWVVGSVVKGGQELTEVKMPHPLALVIGSEQKGVREVIQKQLDVAVTIPMAQPRMSLNVAHATTVFCYEAVRQQKARRRP